MKKSIGLAFVLIAALMSSGCATLADAQSAKGSGTSKVYAKSYDVVWNAVVDTVKGEGLALVSEDKKKGTILAQRSMTALSYGENVAIFVENQSGKTRVEVVNKRAMAANVTAANWEKRIFAALDKRL